MTIGTSADRSRTDPFLAADASVAATHHCGFSLLGAVPEVLRRHDAWSPNHRRRSCALFRLISVRAAPVRRWGWPGVATSAASCGSGAPLERVVERLLLLEDEVDDSGELLGEERRDNWQRLLPAECAIEAPDLREVLNGAHRGMAEGELQIVVAVLRALVPGLRARVARAEDGPAVGYEVRALGKRLTPSTSRSIENSTTWPIQ